MADNNHPISAPPELVKQMATKNGTHYKSLAEHSQSIADQAARWGYEQRGADIWLPISTAPKEPKPFNMFVVIALEVQVRSNSAPYTSDPWCVWVTKDGSFARWPHCFAPTHWCPLPEYDPRRPKPKSQAEEALQALDDAMIGGHIITTSTAAPTIRRALERLRALEARDD